MDRVDASERSAFCRCVVSTVGAAVAGDYNAVLSDILTVREAIGPTAVLKVIIESAALSDEGIV